MLLNACESGDEDVARAALRKAVPTYRTPEEINSKADESEEMKRTKEVVNV